MVHPPVLAAVQRAQNPGTLQDSRWDREACIYRYNAIRCKTSGCRHHLLCVHLLGLLGILFLKTMPANILHGCCLRLLSDPYELLCHPVQCITGLTRSGSRCLRCWEVHIVQNSLDQCVYTHVCTAFSVKVLRIEGHRLL